MRIAARNDGTTTTHVSPRLEVLAYDECVRLLAGSEVGRMAWAGAHGTALVPVNYGWTGTAIVLRTDPGSHLDEVLESVRSPVKVVTLVAQAIDLGAYQHGDRREVEPHHQSGHGADRAERRVELIYRGVDGAQADRACHPDHGAADCADAHEPVSARPIAHHGAVEHCDRQCRGRDHGWEASDVDEAREVIGEPESTEPVR